MQSELSFWDEDIVLEAAIEKQHLSKTIRDINYHNIIEKPSTDLQRDIVEQTIRDHPEGITDLEICIITGFSRSSVTARRNELSGVMAIGYVKIIDPDGDRLNTLWGYSDVSL